MLSSSIIESCVVLDEVLSVGIACRKRTDGVISDLELVATCPHGVKLVTN